MAALVDVQAAPSRSDLLGRARAGDRDAMNDLIAAFEGFVRWHVRNFVLPGMDRDDVVQLGRIGLWQAVTDYDPAYEVTFEHFAALCIRREVTQRVHQFRRRKWQFEFAAYHLENDLDEDRDWGDILEDRRSSNPEEAYIEREDYESTLRLIDSIMSDHQRQVVRLWMSGLPYAEIAARIGRDTRSVDNALQKFKGKLLNYLARRAREEAAC